MSSHKVINESFSSIFNITIPILLTTLTTNLMYITDRAMLAGHSINSMNAASLSGNFIAVFTYIFIGIANAAEVYIGQYNGTKQYDKMATATWQMIYLSFLAMLLFAPMAHFTDRLNIFPEYLLEDGVSYQRPILYCAFCPILISALSTFFIGQGKTKVITSVIIAGSFLNVGLDYIFIYTFDMGAKGAAYATVVSEMLQVVALATAFFNRNNRIIFKTLEGRNFDSKLFNGCIKIGLPLSLGNFISILAWFLIQAAFAHTSQDLTTTYSIGISTYFLFVFVGEGLNKSIATISSNLIGQKNLAGIKKMLKRFIIIAILSGVVVAIPLVFFPKVVLSALDGLNDDISSLYPQIKTLFLWVTLGAIAEAVMSIIWGVLLSGGDTRYPIIVSQICLWTTVVLPIMFLYYYSSLDSVSLVFILTTVWATVSSIFIYARYRSMKWYKILV